MKDYGALRGTLTTLGAQLGKDRGKHQDKALDAVKTGIQFIEAKDQTLLVNSLALRLLAEVLGRKPTAIQSVCIAIYNRHLSTLPGHRTREVAYWKEEECKEALDWCRENLEAKASGLSEMEESRFPDIEESTCGMSVGEVLEIASIIDDFQTNENEAVKQYILALADRKFKQACEKSDDDSKTSG